MKYKALKTIFIFLLAISGFAHANPVDDQLAGDNRVEDKRTSTWRYEIILQEALNEACGRGWGSSTFFNIGLDKEKEKTVDCINAKKKFNDYKEYLSSNTNSSERFDYAYERIQEFKESSKRLSYIQGSPGKYVFTTFFDGLVKWVGADGNSEGKFQLFAEGLTTVLEKVMVLFVILLAASAFFNKFTQHLEKGVKTFIAFVVVLAFLEWNTFNYWIFEPLLSLLIAAMKVLFASNAKDLGDVIFGVDEHFEKLFASVEAYDKLLEEKGAWYSFQILKQIVAYLIVGMFGALYAIFTILIIVGFFGFMLLLGFAPVFMAIGIFNKGIFFSWLKATMNYFLIPIFTAAVMSITLIFIREAAIAIQGLLPTDSIFIKDIGFVFLVGIFSIGLHWKAPEFAAGITGGMASGAGSIVGTAAAVGGAAWALTKSPIGGTRNAINTVSGMRGGGFGNQMSGSYQAGKRGQELWDRLRDGGVK